MKKTTIKNIGRVAVKDIVLCDTEIGLYMPIEKMSANIQAKYEECSKYFDEEFSKRFPSVNPDECKEWHDISLHMDVNNSEVRYYVSIIIWAEDNSGNELYTGFYDPFEVEINSEDNKYLKKLVMNKLIESFF